MKYSIDHNIEPSVYLWLDNLLIEKNQGFGTFSGNFNHTTTFISGYNSFSSPHRQYVYDSTISGAVVPDGVYVDGNFLSSNFVNITSDLTTITSDSTIFTADLISIASTGASLDFYRGQALLTGSPNSIISAQYSFKEINVYFTTNTDKQVLFENKFVQNARSKPRYDNFNAKDVSYPCIFIKSSAGKNHTLAFDGCSATNIPVRMIVLADSLFLYRAITAALRDSVETFIPIFNPSELPLNHLYSLVGPFDYSTMANTIQQDANRLAFIKNVAISDFQDKVSNLIGPQVFAGFVDIDLELVRFPRS